MRTAIVLAATAACLTACEVRTVTPSSGYDVTYTVNGQPDTLSLRVGNGDTSSSVELVHLTDEGIVRKGTGQPGQRLSLEADALGDATGWVDCEIKAVDTVATSFGWGKCTIELTINK